MEIKLNDHYYSENGFFMLATLHNCLAIVASNHEVVLYLAMTQHHGNEGAQQIAGPPPALQENSFLVTKTCFTFEEVFNITFKEVHV